MRKDSDHWERDDARWDSVSHHLNRLACIMTHDPSIWLEWQELQLLVINEFFWLPNKLSTSENFGNKLPLWRTRLKTRATEQPLSTASCNEVAWSTRDWGCWRPPNGWAAQTHNVSRVTLEKHTEVLLKSGANSHMKQSSFQGHGVLAAFLFRTMTSELYCVNPRHFVSLLSV